MAVQQDRRLRLFARVLPARDGGVKLNLWPIAQGGSATTQTLPSLGAVNAEGEKIAERDFSTHEIKIGGLRIVHKQRLSKNLVFLGLRAPGGMLIESILRSGVYELERGDSDPTFRLHQAWATGDVVSVTGMMERAKGRLSIHARVIELEEGWSDLFGRNAVFRDDVHHGAGMPTSMWRWQEQEESSRQWLLLLQVTASHAARLQEYLTAVHRITPLATVAPIAGPQNPHDERLLLIQTDKPAETVRDVLGDGAMARFVQRWYVINRLTATLNAAADALNAAVRGHTSGDNSDAGNSDGPVPVRVQAFPRALELRLVEQLRKGGVVTPDPRAPVVLNCAFVFGALAVGLADCEGEFRAALRGMHAAVDQRQFARPGRTVGGAPEQPPSVPRPQEEDEEEARASASMGGLVSRAFYKLREVASRMDLRLDVSHAIDCGASPGGWTVCLCNAGCGKVTAVDPGLLNLPPHIATSGKVEHMRMKIEEAIPLLEERGGVRLEMLVSDMNAPPPDVVAIAMRALPLLAEGAPLVLTFKNTYVRKVEWHLGVEAALAQLRTFADGVEIMHLMANTSRETTVCGRVKRSAAGANGARASHAIAAEAAGVAEAWARLNVLRGVPAKCD